ncbi:integrase, catalytic region, zinc finger, CCHC-type containing protein [Tanacetum coccineum]
MTAHSSYIKHTQEEALVLRDIVEHVKANYPQDPLLESAFRKTELDKKVRFAKSFTSTENTKPASTSNIVSNKRVLHSTGVGPTLIVGKRLPFIMDYHITMKCLLGTPIVLDSISPKPVVVKIVPLASKTKVLVMASSSISFELRFYQSFGKTWTCTRKTYLLHVDLWGTVRVASVSGKKYILVIVDDYSRFTWVKCLRSKDEAPAFIINFLKMISHLNFGSINHLARHGLVRGLPKLKFEKDHLCSACALGKSSKKPHKPKSEDTNQEKLYLLHMDLPVAKAPLFLWAEAVATACYTQNRSMIRHRHGKTPYELLHNKPPDLSYLHVFGALCYPTNDSENLGKLQPKADIGIFIGYAPTKKAFRIYNRRTRRIIETIHVDFDELTAMASEHSSSGPALHEMTPVSIKVIAPIPEAVAPEHAVSTGSPSSTTVDQDAPSLSNSHTT